MGVLGDVETTTCPLMICQGNTGQMHREIRQDAGLAHWSRTCGKEWREFRKGGSTFLFHRDNQKRFEED